MNVVEPKNYWDGIIKGVDPGEEEFTNILNMLDFPMESLEGDDLTDWDLSKFQNLGPIPLEALTGLPPVSQGNVFNGSVNMGLSYNAPMINIESGKKQLPNYVEDTPFRNFISPESSALQTPSPVSVLESSGSNSSGKILSIGANIAIPVRARSKRARPSRINPWLLIPPVTYTASVSKKTSNTGRNKEKKRTMSHLSNGLEATEYSTQQVKNKLSEEPNAMEKKETSFLRSAATKKCTHCEVTKTPQWREGPLGPKTLCNACGVRYRSGRLFPEYRPAASPTFVPSLHSNSHRKVIEMRKKGSFS